MAVSAAILEIFNVKEWPDLDLGAGHAASLIDLYLHTKFHRNRKNFLWMDGRKDIRTDICDPYY